MSSSVFHGGGVADAAARYGRPASQWLDLSTGINPNPAPLPDLDPSLWHRLPDSDLMLAASRAAMHFYGSGNVLPVASPGTQPLIRLAAGLVRSGQRVAILSPTYGEYRAVFSANGFDVDEIDDFSGVRQDHGAVVVVNPNNPDGRVYSRADLLALALEAAEKGTMLIVDEAFCELRPEISLASEAQNNPHLIVLRSFGKFFGLAGLRLAFAICGSAYRSQIEEALGPWPVSGPALEIARHIFEGGTSEIRMRIRQAHDGLIDTLISNGLTIAGGTELFTLVRHENAGAIHEHLCREGILTRKFAYRSDWLRIGLCGNEEELLRLRGALQNWRG